MTIPILSRGKISFFVELCLILLERNYQKQKIQSDDEGIQAQGYEALSNAYNTVVDDALCQFDVALKPMWLAPIRIVLWTFTWFLLAGWCWWRMLPLSNRMFNIIGFSGMSDKQHSDRICILIRTVCWRFWKVCV